MPASGQAVRRRTGARAGWPYPVFDVLNDETVDSHRVSRVRGSTQCKTLAKVSQICDNEQCLNRWQRCRTKKRYLYTGSRQRRYRKASTNDLDSQVAVCFCALERDRFTVNLFPEVTESLPSSATPKLHTDSPQNQATQGATL